MQIKIKHISPQLKPPADWVPLLIRILINPRVASWRAGGRERGRSGKKPCPVFVRTDLYVYSVHRPANLMGPDLIGIYGPYASGSTARSVVVNSPNLLVAN